MPNTKAKPTFFEITSTTVNDIGKELKRIREDKKISQPQLAKKLNLSQPNISYIENKAYGPIKNLVSYLETMGYSIYIGPASKKKKNTRHK